ncbi:uncharacterized protein [Littorina saxatilis]|uniref:EF-hand domain-containing protein n=1 Tax=Littorina saxatilis TaxID=31220 RepID=A0AAN9AL50_9CAEN
MFISETTFETERLPITMSIKATLVFAILGLAAGQTQIKTTFQLLDANQDNSISVAEIEIFCNSLDQNGDGYLDFGEFARENVTMEQSPELKAQFTFYDNISGVMDDKVICRDDAFTFFGKLDMNGDGKVRETEFNTRIAAIRQSINGPKPPVGK